MKFLPLGWAAWAHCQVSKRSYPSMVLKKKGSQEHCFNSILFNYWI